MRIENAQPAHRSAVQAIYDAEVLSSVSTFDIAPRSEATWRAFWRAHESPDRPLLVALEGERVLGWAALSAWSERCGYARTAEVSVYVDGVERGRGLGKALLTALIQRARERELGVLVSRIEASQAPSLALHRGLGFKECGRMRRAGEKFGRLLDVVLMDLSLDEAAS